MNNVTLAELGHGDESRAAPSAHSVRLYANDAGNVFNDEDMIGHRRDVMCVYSDMQREYIVVCGTDIVSVSYMRIHEPFQRAKYF